MGNTLSGKIWNLDTAAAVFTTQERIKYIEWTPAGDSDDLVLSTAAGQVIVQWKASSSMAANTPVFKQAFDELTVVGLTVTTIDGGTVRVHTA